MNSNASIINAERFRAVRYGAAEALSPPIRSVSLRWWFYLGALLVLLVVRGITAGGGIPEQWGPSVAIGGQTVAVEAAPARRGQLNIYLNEVGTVMPLKTVAIRTGVDGELSATYFQEGQPVKAGDRWPRSIRALPGSTRGQRRWRGIALSHTSAGATGRYRLLAAETRSRGRSWRPASQSRLGRGGKRDRARIDTAS